MCPDAPPQWPGWRAGQQHMANQAAILTRARASLLEPTCSPCRALQMGCWAWQQQHPWLREHCWLVSLRRPVAIMVWNAGKNTEFPRRCCPPCLPFSHSHRRCFCLLSLPQRLTHHLLLHGQGLHSFWPVERSRPRLLRRLSAERWTNRCVAAVGPCLQAGLQALPAHACWRCTVWLQWDGWHSCSLVMLPGPYALHLQVALRFRCSDDFMNKLNLGVP